MDESGEGIRSLAEIEAGLDTLFSEIKRGTLGDLCIKRDIVFLPYKASCWDSLAWIYKEVIEDPQYNVHVIPIPWYYREADGTLCDKQYEGGLFPADIPITDYRDYDFAARHPSAIFIHNPYDEYNSASSVDPFFYARNLYQYTDALIYTPWFRTMDFDYEDPDSLKLVYNMRYYATVPGVVRADLVLLPSEKLRQAYIEALAEFAGEGTRAIWEKKIQYFEERPGGGNGGAASLGRSSPKQRRGK